MELIPSLSVIMPVYNGELYLRQAVESILNQTFKDFEFIIIDDGSNDNTPGIIDSYKDRRIKRFRNEFNQGVAKALNRAVEIAQGEFIARMDADDISLPSRLQRQIAYLNEHPEIGVLGTWAQFIDERNNFISTLRPPTSDALIAWALIFGNCMTHASIVFRRKLIKDMGGYAIDFLHGEDYELWARMSRITKFANMPEVLICKRRHKGTVESRFSETQEQTRVKILRQILSERLKREVFNGEVAAIDGIERKSGFNSSFEVSSAVTLIEALFRSFLSQRILRKDEKEKVCLDVISKIRIIARRNIRRFPMQSIYACYRSSIINPRIFGFFISDEFFNKVKN